MDNIIWLTIYSIEMWFKLEDIWNKKIRLPYRIMRKNTQSAGLHEWHN